MSVFLDDERNQKNLSTVNGWTQSWRKAACITREDTVIAKIRSLSVNQTQNEEIPNTHGFLAKCYDKEEKSKFTTKQLSPNVQMQKPLQKPQKSQCIKPSEKKKQCSSLIPLSCGTSMPTIGAFTIKICMTLNSKGSTPVWWSYKSGTDWYKATV